MGMLIVNMKKALTQWEDMEKTSASRGIVTIPTYLPACMDVCTHISQPTLDNAGRR